MATHDEVLARIALPWIDIAPSRRALPKRALPANANEPSPNVVVRTLATDKTSLGICSQFRLKHWKPSFNEAHVPTAYAWQFLTPDDERLMLFTWVNWRRNSRQLFEDFCRETGRQFGRLSPQGAIALGEKNIPFRQCRIIHEDQLRPRPPMSVKAKSAKAILAAAEQLLKRRKSQYEEIDDRDQFDDAEAHDAQLQEQLEKCFRANLAKYEKALTSEYGPPATMGSGEHRDIPINGVLRYVIWKVGKKSLYLALSHEDVELPYVIYLGVRI